MQTTNIYMLIDPRTNLVRYVGKANDVNKRYYKHYQACEVNTHKSNWIKLLKKEKLRPIVETIDVVPIDNWCFWEKFWISQMKTWGFDLLNYTIGGDGCTFGNRTSFKKGHNLSKGRKTSDATKDKLREANLGKKASLYTKEKMSNTRKGKMPVNVNNLISKGEKTRFVKGCKVWNDGKSGYVLGGKKKAKPVIQFSLSGMFICDFISVKEASESTNINVKAIRRCCYGKSHTSGGFKWKYKT